ncbi:MAG: DUF4177 domain-containing protein [Roseinatronobacter sp.]
MQFYEYLALPAPRRGSKVKGLKEPSERFAHAVTELMNEVAAEGWEFWRSESLPSEERKGLTGTTVVQNNLLIFRRPGAATLAEHLDEDRAAPSPVSPARPEPASAARPVRIAPVLPEQPTREAPIYDTRREPSLRPQRDQDR